MCVIIMAYVTWFDYRIKRKSDHILSDLVVDIWRVNLSWKNYLAKIYHDPVNVRSFSGPETFYKYVGQEKKYVLSKYKIRKWLQRQEAYSLQRGFWRCFKQNKVIAFVIDDEWDVDLDMSKYKKEKLWCAHVVINICSKFWWMPPLQDKKSQNVTVTFKHVLREGCCPTRLRSD